MKNFNKKTILALSAIFAILSLNGCAQTEEYKTFVKEHGSNDYYYCDKETGFFMHSQIFSNEDHPSIYPIRNDLNQPTRCPNNENVNVSVLESASGTSRVF